MPCIHKTFSALRTVFLLLAVIIFPHVTAQALANPLYTVSDVQVDITAQSAVAARERAFDQAQLEAFNMLAGRFLPPAQLTNFPAPDVNTISSMIQDFEIDREQLSRVRYVASYTFRFKEPQVRNYFASLGADIHQAQQNFREEQFLIQQQQAQTQVDGGEAGGATLGASARAVLVLPFIERSGRFVIWSQGNAWRNAWNRQQSGESFFVPMGDIADIADVREDNPQNLNTAGIAKIQERYGAQQAAILVARPDATLQRVASEDDAALGVMVIEFYRTDRGRPEYVRDLVVTASAQDTLKTLMDRAVVEAKAALVVGWEEMSAPRSPEFMVQYRVRIPYSSLREWSQLQQAIRRVNAISDFNIRSVSPREAQAEFAFDGSFEMLERALSGANLSLRLNNAMGGTSGAMGQTFMAGQVIEGELQMLNRFQR
ncbi:MAG: hypothetical protein ACK4VI_00100 [Alphaproteobacteria bacterium]